MWNNIVEPGKQHIAISHMRIAGWMAEATTHTHNMYYLQLFHCNNCYMKGSACYVIRTLPALLCNAMTGEKIINACICNLYTTLIHMLLKQDHNPLLHHILLLHMRRSLPVSSSSAG